MPQHDVLIAGGGLTGLACAHHLQQAGISSKVLESGDAVGGRVRTDEVDGFLLDRGFQVLLTAYPEAQELLDYDALDLRAFYAGALVHRGDAFHHVGDPLRAPLAAPRSLAAPVGSLLDKLKVIRLRRSVTGPSLDELWARPEVSTLRALQTRYGFSETMIERFFRPFLGGILLDRELTASSKAFEFYFRMFATGKTAVPAGGMQRIPEQMAAGLPEHSIRLHSRVRKAEPRRVTLESGEQLEAEAVVLAVEAPELAYLRPGFDPPDSRSTVCLYFAAPEPPHTQPILVLDGDGTGPVNHLAVMSAVSETYAPPGQALISASVVGNPSLTDKEVERQARNQLRQWYGAVVDDWRLLKSYRVLHALPAQPPPALTPPERPVRLGDGIFVCGDHRTNASINGALRSGRLAAEAVAAHLGAGGR